MIMAGISISPAIMNEQQKKNGNEAHNRDPAQGRSAKMEKRSFKVEEQFCDECALALRRFIGHLDGVESIEVENKMIAVVFNPSKMPDQELDRITKDSLEKLGHTLIE